jgi:hypothetical protein
MLTNALSAFQIRGFGFAPVGCYGGGRGVLSSLHAAFLCRKPGVESSAPLPAGVACYFASRPVVGNAGSPRKSNPLPEGQKRRKLPKPELCTRGALG